MGTIIDNRDIEISGIESKNIYKMKYKEFTLTLFGYTKWEARRKFKSYIREKQQEKLYERAKQNKLFKNVKKTYIIH